MINFYETQEEKINLISSDGYLGDLQLISFLQNCNKIVRTPPYNINCNDITSYFYLWEWLLNEYIKN